MRYRGVGELGGVGRENARERERATRVKEGGRGEFGDLNGLGRKKWRERGPG